MDQRLESVRLLNEELLCDHPQHVLIAMINLWIDKCPHIIKYRAKTESLHLNLFS